MRECFPLQYVREANRDEEDKEDDDSRHMFFSHIARTYGAFLQGKDDEMAVLEDALVSNFGERVRKVAV